MEVVGFYLARAGDSATPEDLDVELRPGLSYLLTAIYGGAVVESRSWCVHADGRLEEEAVDATTVAPPPALEEALQHKAE